MTFIGPMIHRIERALGISNIPRTPGVPSPDDTVELSPQSLDPLPTSTDETLRTPAHRLTRPVLLIHGIGQGSDTTWFNLKNFLCSNPHNRFGAVYTKSGEHTFLERAQEIGPQARVFSMDLDTNLDAPAKVAEQVGRALALIEGWTGCRDIDVVTHSMGALVAREYLREGGSHIRNLIMIAPPNHGAAFADLARLGYPLGFFRGYPDGARQGLAALGAQIDVGPWHTNRYLAGLDHAWTASSRKVHAAILAGSGVPTLQAGVLPVASGDGLVTVKSARLPHADFYLASTATGAPGTPQYRAFQSLRFNHLQVVSDVQFLRQVDTILAADPAPGPPPEPRQEDLFASKPPADPAQGNLFT
ncbi:MAG: DUF7379 domain-containing protein [Candidatus Xenobia bacterium]